MKVKITFLAMALGVVVNRGAAAQGMPVIDISSITAAIANGYTMVQQLYSMYETVKTTYEQLQQQIKSFESFDFNSLDAKDPLGSWNSLTTYANRMATYEQNIESIINRKDIKIGNKSYSLGDIFKKAIGDIDPFEKMLSPEEREMFTRIYGMGYGKYMRIKQMQEMLQKKAAEVIGYSGGMKTYLEEDRQRLSEITKNMFASESTIQQQQITNGVLSVMAQDMKTQANLVGDIASQLAISAAQAQVEKQAMQEEINMNSLGIAEGFLKMLEDMEPESAYR